MEDLIASHAHTVDTTSSEVAQLRQLIVDLTYKLQLEESQIPSRIGISETLNQSELSNQERRSDSLTELKDLLLHLKDETTRLNKEKQIIESLMFPSIHAREDQISEATESTFDWIFSSGESGSTNFVQWLTSEEPLFWLTGKAGSGKSTLMKFLARNSRVRKALQRANSNSEVCIGTFYFWNAGTSLQKSQEGLFRSLLSQIFKRIPDMIPSVVPKQWAQPGIPAWTHANLSTAFSKLKDQRFENVKFFFFIDGLDEYTGDLEELTIIINSMLAANLKLCVASRLWNIFEAAWGSNHGFKLILHDHTKGDIYKFVQKEFSEHGQFKELKSFDKRYQDLVNEIIERANGVFLWVFLLLDPSAEVWSMAIP